jgi:hypothetical protein
MLDDDDNLLRAMAALEKYDPARASQLRCRTMDYHSAFVPCLAEIYRLINRREWHALEGWDDIPGNVQIEYRLAPTSDAWLTDEDFQRLPALAQNAVLAASEEDRRYLRRRRVSPAEVQHRERAGLLKLPDWVIAELIGFEFATEMKVQGAYFNEVRDIEISREGRLYVSAITDRDGRLVQLPDDKYLGVVNPFCPSVVFVHDAGRRFLGTAALETRIDRTEDQLRLAYGRQAKRLNELTAPLIARHAKDARAETARLKHNADVLSSRGEDNDAARERVDAALARAAEQY